MKTVDIHEAKTQLSRLVDEVVRGEAVVIAKAGRPLVQMMTVGGPPAPPARLGLLSGQIQTPADFDRIGESEIEMMFGGQR
ncbi:MAG: type II toxin-antitoxin system prevent-host-death family antitoxin [Acidobacteria bacterium]|nr:type II toxin-antitoxin system prevent-host-death family antitoxin [Acidobacteriota bacterium]